jgi:hypothetical protein
MSLETAMAKFASADAPSAEPAGDVDVSTSPTTPDEVSPAASAPEQPPAEAETEAPPPPADDRQIRRELSAEKLAILRQKSAEAKAKGEANRILEEAKREREAAAAERARLDSLKQDWRKLPEVLGVPASEVLQLMTQQALEEGTPEAAIKRFHEQLPTLIKAELDPIRAQNEALKAQLEEIAAERRAIQEQRAQEAAVASFTSILETSKFADLTTHYDTGYLVKSANALGKYWQSQQIKYTLHDIAEALLSSHQEAEAKRRREPPADQRVTTVNGAEVKAAIVGNSTAAGTTAAPKLSRKERIAKLSRGH